LRERGVVVEYEKTPSGYTFREYNCPFKDSVTSHPEICSMVHSLMEEVLPQKPRQVTSISRGDDRCEFELAASSATPARPATAVPAMSGEV
jgi:predicted ArsR family transcriptional regulator